MKDHIISEAVAKQNGILEHCMYCNHNFSFEDNWKVEPVFFTNYVSVTCSSCHKEHRFKDENIHSIEDIINKKK